MLRFRIAGLMAVIIAGAVAISAAASQERRPIDKADIYVWDGDTIRTPEHGRIRLRTCDAPEFLWPHREAATKATERLKQLVEQAQTTELVCKWEPRCQDIFRRLVCDLLRDGQNACDILINEGLAVKQGRMTPCSRNWSTVQGQ